MADIKKNLYNIALGNQGYVLQGTPTKIARVMKQMPLFENRYASGDRGFGDFSYRWFWAQESFVGMKNKDWADDGYVQYSTNLNLSQVENIDPYMELQATNRKVFSSTDFSHLSCLEPINIDSTPTLFTALQGATGKVPNIYWTTDGTTYTACGNAATILPDIDSSIQSLQSFYHIANTGLKSPSNTSVSNYVGGGETAWDTPTNAYASNDTYATASDGTDFQDWYQFGFNIPTGSTIKGIEVRIEAKVDTLDYLSDPAPAIDSYLRKNSTTYTTTSERTPRLSLTDTTYTLGGSNYLWGTTWTPAEINSSDFGVTLSLAGTSTPATTYSVDHITVTVYYLPPVIMYGAVDTNNKAFIGINNSKELTDVTSDIVDTSYTAGRLVKEVLDTLWAGYDASDSLYLKSYDGSDWNLAFSIDFCSWEGGDFEYFTGDGKYYALVKSTKENKAILYQWQGSGNPLKIYEWINYIPGQTGGLFSGTGKSLKDYKNKLYILLQNYSTGKSKVVSLNSSGVLNEEYTSTSTAEDSYTALKTDFQYGFVEHNGLLYCTGAVTDGTYWWGGNNATVNGFAPMCSFLLSGAEDYTLWGTSSSGDGNNLRLDELLLTTGTDYAFLETNPFNASLPNSDKLWLQLTLNFETFTTGGEIVAQYDIGSGFVTLGTISYTDNGAINNYTFDFPANTTSKTIKVKFKIKGYSTVIHNFTVAYLPSINAKFQWDLSVKLMDNLILLDGNTRESKKADTLRSVLKNDYFNKNIVAFQDIDYAETTLTDDPLSSTATTVNVASTSAFPEQGRIKIENEEILYTRRTATSFTGCTRGARGSTAVSHALNTAVNNGYNVLISNYAEQTPIGTESKVKESLVTLRLIEI